MPYSRLFLVLLAVAFSHAVAQDANSTTTACSSQVHTILTSPLYADCQRDVAAFRETDEWPAWVFTMSEKDAAHGSEACMTVLLDLQNNIPSGACQTTLSGPQDGMTIDVTIARAALDQVAAACRRLRRLRTGAKPSVHAKASQESV